jgi:hypothetical protein
MAYYDPLIAAWNNPTQPPPGVTGAGLVGGDSTQTKLNKVNAWTVTGAIPTSFLANNAEMLNAIVWTEFKALTQAQQNTVFNALQVMGPLLSGTDNQARLLPGMLLEFFVGGSATRTNLIALAKAVTSTWCKANGYPEAQTGGGGLTMIDAQAAGLV